MKSNGTQIDAGLEKKSTNHVINQTKEKKV